MGGAAAGANNPLAAAQEMLAKAQEELAATKVEGSAGGGAVRITMSGDQKIVGVAIEPDVVHPDDVEMLQDLIMAAIADASERASELQAKSFGAITGGLNLPGLGLG
jgi:DNA-binding YbaB/EbfC family protein